MASNEVSTPEVNVGNESLKKLATYLGISAGALITCYIAYRYIKTSSKGDASAGVDDTEKATIATKPTEDSSEDRSETAEDESPLEHAKRAKERGNKFFKAQKFEKAIEFYQQAISLCPASEAVDISTFHGNLAACHEQLKNWQGCVDECTKAINLNSRYTKALFRRAKAYELLDQKMEALEDVSAVALLGDRGEKVMMMANRVLTAIGQEKAAKHFKEREKVLPSNYYVRSYLDSFSKDLFTIPSSEDNTEGEKGSYEQVMESIHSNNFSDVSRLCTEEIDNDGEHKNRALLLRGTMNCLCGDLPLSISDLDQILELEDSEENNQLKSNALIKLASMKMQEGDGDGCYQDFDLAEKLSPNDASIYHHRGQLYFMTERLELAKTQFERAISLDSKFVAPRCHLGFCLSKIAMQLMSPSQMHEANEVLEETTRMFPKSAEAWSLYGQLLQDQQEFEKASEKLNKALELSPNNPTTYVYKALLILQTKQTAEGLDEAIKQIQKAIEIDDKCDFAYETLASLEMQRGNREEAERLFSRVLEFARTEAEMIQATTMMEAARVQAKMVRQYGITVPDGGFM